MARPPTAQPMAQPMALPMALPMARQTAPARKWRLHNAAQFSLDADKLMMQWFMQKLLLAKKIPSQVICAEEYAQCGGRVLVKASKILFVVYRVI